MAGATIVVSDDGKKHNSEIHWFEHEDAGQVDFKVKNPSVRYRDVSEATKKDIRNLLDRHTQGHEVQQDADYEIAHHIANEDTIGKAIIGKSAEEIRAWEEHVEKERESHEKRYQEQIADMKEGMKPGGYLENYNEQQLKDMGYWPEETEFREPKFYRKGDIGAPTLAFTTSENGANMTAATDPDGGIGYDHAYTLKEMMAMGYVPIAGIKSFDVGMSGESEVLFASQFPTPEQLAGLTHRDVTVNSPGKQEARKAKDDVDAKYDKAFNDISQEMSKIDLKSSDSQKRYMALADKFRKLDEEKKKEYTAIGKKYGVTLGDNVVPYDIANDPSFES